MYDKEGVCGCGHGREEHSYRGCDAYTPHWPALVRCSCTEFPDFDETVGPLDENNQIDANR